MKNFKSTVTTTLTCKKTGLKVLRHDGLREVFLRHCVLGAVEAERETPDLLPDSNERPADVLLRASPNLSTLKILNFAGSAHACLDFAVTHTLQPKFIERASVSAGVAAAEYECKVKDKAYATKCNQNGLDFVPMVTECMGGQRAKPVLKFVSRAVANRKNLDEDVAQTYLQRACSVVLQRHNAIALLRHRDPQEPQHDGALPSLVV